MGLISINIKEKSFVFLIKSNGRSSYWTCKPIEKNHDVLILNLKQMMEEGVAFNVGSLATFHHKISIKAFTTQNINGFDGALDVLNKLVDIGAITKSESKEIESKLLGGK